MDIRAGAAGLPFGDSLSGNIQLFRQLFLGQTGVFAKLSQTLALIGLVFHYVFPFSRGFLPASRS